MKITMPASLDIKRYTSFVDYFACVMEAGGCEVVRHGRCGDQICGQGLFYCQIESGPRFIVDYSDFDTCRPCLGTELPRFKYHYSDCHLPADGRVFPFSPISFYDWDEFARLSQEIHYSVGDVVQCNQTPHPESPNWTRRTWLRTMLAKIGADLAVTDQVQYWKKINRSLVHVFAPGTRNDMLDRGQIQYWAFGCCTISPYLADVLPRLQKPTPGVHYVECRADYSDVIEKIAWCRSHREECLSIGRAAKELFRKTSVPLVLVPWVRECLETYEKMKES